MTCLKRTSALIRQAAATAIVALYGAAIYAQTVSDGHLSYAMGAVSFLETPRVVMMFKGDRLLGSSAIRPGGWLSPAVSVSEEGHIHWGELVFDSVSGNQIRPSRLARCLTKAVQQPGVLTFIYDNRLIVVSPESDKDGRTVAYLSETRQYPDCRATDRHRIVPTDVDHFFELGASKSGLWLIGSAADGTLLIRKWSGEWARVASPPDINGILSAHWSSDGKLWVLANELSGDKVTPTIFMTDDLGKQWLRQPFSRAVLPDYWLEALRQLSAEDPSK